MVAGFVIVAVLDAINRIYDSYPIAKDRPIKVFVQVIKIFVISAIIITIVSEFIGESPRNFLVGLGAFAAVVKNPFMAAVSATSFMGVCGEIAVGMSQGPGTLQLHLYDVMYNLSREQFMQIVRVSE